MIVHPDFLDHWKTRALEDAIGPMAPIHVIRLWAHCQNRRAWRFDGMSAKTFAAICRWPKDPAEFLDAMIAAGFVKADAAGVEVHQWRETNATMVASWSNGSKGGRPRKDAPTDGNPAPECAVEPPKNFPRSRDEAVAHAAFVGMTEEQAETEWNLAMGRNGRDSRGQPILSWRHYLTARAKFARSRDAEKQIGTASGAGERF